MDGTGFARMLEDIMLLENDEFLVGVLLGFALVAMVMRTIVGV